MAQYRYRTYQCSGQEDDGEHSFEIFIEADQHPKFCPICGAAFEGEVEAVPGTHSIGGSAITRSVDAMYRDLETSSAERAEMAGNPQLKITNMKDGLREGDVAAVMPNNAVSQYMDQARQNGMGFGFGGGAAFGPAVSSVPNPVQPDPTLNGYTGPGHLALSGIQGTEGRAHLAHRAQATVAGQIKDST